MQLWNMRFIFPAAKISHANKSFWPEVTECTLETGVSLLSHETTAAPTTVFDLLRRG